MSQPTPDDLGGPDKKDEQQTQLQWPNEGPSPVLQTGIQAVSSAPRLEVGPIPLTRVANYELLKEVGRGGMGVVFKARDVRLNRIVALKMIRGGTLANSEERQRFEKEAAAAAQLQHPNIVALYEVSPFDQQPFLSMEFIGGTSLAERVSLGPLSGRRAAEYLEVTARAVHYAHTRGIVHRDLKPANVLLDENDQPKITDFGLAKQMETESDQTRTGAILGTPSYMSPEQAAGSKNITPASDVYSLGAVLYELLTGKPPFCGETPLKTLNLVETQDPIPPRMLAPSVDRDLETICLKCLEKSPARRYESAEALADDLRRYLQGEAITARRVSMIGRGVKWVRRNPGLTWLIAGGVVAAILLLSVSWYIAYQEMELRNQEKHQRDEAVKANKLAELRLDSMRHLLYLSEMRQAQQALRRADLEGSIRILNHWLPDETLPEMRDWEWYFLKDRAEARLAFGSHPGQARTIDYRPDGRQLASAGGKENEPGEIRLWDPRSGTLMRKLTGHAGPVTALAYHPTRPLLASASLDRTVKVWNIDTGKEVVTLRGHSGPVYDVAFSKAGERLASGSHDHTVRIWDYEHFLNEPEQSVRVIASHDLPVTTVAFHPNGQILASGASDRLSKTGGRDRAIKLWNAANGQLEKALTDHEGDVESLAFSADGKMLVSGGGLGTQRGEIVFWDIDASKLNNSKLKDRRHGLSDRILHVSMSRSGKVAAAVADGLLRIWNPERSTEPLTLRADPQAVNGVAFAPDGYSLASAGRSGRVSMWNSSAGSESLSLAAPGAMKTVAFNPKGPFLAAAGAPDGSVLVWDLDSPDQPLRFNDHKASVECIAFSPDGNFLASGGADRIVRIVDFRDRARSVTLEGDAGLVRALAYRPDGKLVASAGEDEVIRLHDPATGKLDRVLRGHTNGILCLAFSPDGRWLASGAWGTKNQLCLWDLEKDLVYKLEGHTGSINSVAFNPDDRQNLTLASAGSDHVIRVWNVAKRELAYKLEGTPDDVLSLAFHPRGQRIVSIGTDRLIRVWDIVTRQEILDFEEHVGTLRRVVFSPDGRSLAGAGNGVVRVWQASKEMPDARK
jgi:WD40 repeat protein/tRNA A-37 threonylcarbamoyl transferase component Bud32